MWRYANDILKGVEIQSVFPSTTLTPTHRYSFKIVTEETYMHDTWHANLFIPVLSDNIIMDGKGIFDFREELFTMKDHLSKNLNPGLPGTRLSHFNSVGNDNFSTKYFLVGSATLLINSDDIASFKSFWTALNIQFAACTKPSVQYLPTFSELSPAISLRDQVYPPSTFGESFEIKSFLDYVGTLLLNLLERESLTEKAPMARSYLNEVLHSDYDG